MFLGRLQLGDLLPLVFSTTDASDTPTLPDAPPSVIIYNDSGAIIQKLLPVVDRYIVTGLFFLPVIIDNQFAAGRHRVLFSYMLSSTAYAKTAEFEVLSSGGTDGMASAMHMFQLPNVDYAVIASNRGRIKRFRNPRPL